MGADPGYEAVRSLGGFQSAVSQGEGGLGVPGTQWGTQGLGGSSRTTLNPR